jgi:CRISPR-associated protein Cmr1
VSPRPGAPEARQALDRATAALWLLMHLGGVGSRSRRTAGSLSVTGEHQAAGLQFALPGDPARAAARLEEGLGLIRRQMDTGRALRFHGPSAYDVLHPDVCSVWVLGMWGTWHGAVEAIGRRMLSFRGPRSVEEMAVFGLPVPFRDHGAMGFVQGDGVDRRASPLWLKVSKVTDGRHLGVATLFKSEFLPHGRGLRVGARGGNARRVAAPADYALIEGWIAEAFPNRREVSLG